MRYKITQKILSFFLRDRCNFRERFEYCKRLPKNVVITGIALVVLHFKHELKHI